MRLNAKQQSRLLQKIGTIWDGRPCPVCNSLDGFAIPDVVYELVECDPGSYPGPAVTPLVASICENCGYTLTFSATVLGIVDQQTRRLIDE